MKKLTQLTKYTLVFSILLALDHVSPPPPQIAGLISVKHSEPSQTSKVKSFTKRVNYFCKNLCLGCLSGF